MKTKRALRVSGFKDYIAVDIIDEKTNVLATPFYLKPNKTIVVKYFDTEESKFYITEVSINDDFTKLKFKDVDENSDFTGMEWDSDFDELLDEHIIKFIL